MNVDYKGKSYQVKRDGHGRYIYSRPLPRIRYTCKHGYSQFNVPPSKCPCERCLRIPSFKGE